MTASYEIAVLVGSLRRDGFTSRTVRALAEVAPPGLSLRTVEIRDLPIYDQDLDGDKAPASYAPFRQAVANAAAVLFVTPEYNRSVPGGLKNAIDVGSRPYGQSVFNAKPAGVVSVSPSPLGGFGANHALRQSLVFLNMPAMQMPEAYITNAATLFDEAGKLNNDGTRGFLTTFMAAFAAWVGRAA